MPDLRERTYLQTPEQWTSFVSAFLHELRTPLGSLTMLAELLDDSQSDSHGERERRCTANIRLVVREILALVGDVDELSRLLAGRASVRPEEVDLARLIAEVEEAFRPQAWERGIGLSFSLDPALPSHFHIDRDRLRQLLMLLLEAAVQKARSELFVRLDVEDERLRVVVSSDGTPFAEVSSGLFEPFGEGARAGGGRSLALTLAHVLALALGGTLRGENRGKLPALTLDLPPATQ